MNGKYDARLEKMRDEKIYVEKEIKEFSSSQVLEMR